MFDLNPIDVLKQREVKVMPPHFSKIKISDADFWEGEFSSWIQNKLKGRYCIVKIPSIDKDEKLRTATFVAFEEQKELTYFMLACPHLRRT
jgi:hypothetical protein